MPLSDSGELDTALAFLNFNRESVFTKIAGLNDEQLRRVLVGSGTNLLGLIRHLASAERYWFGLHLTGVRRPGWNKFGMRVPKGTTAEEVISNYRSAIADSNAAIVEAGDPQAPLAKPVAGQQLTLRWLLAHMTSETARHAGHADILREQIDGTRGRG